jgi:hypothetical protein
MQKRAFLTLYLKSQVKKVQRERQRRLKIKANEMGGEGGQVEKMEG